jgi:hypothetical protein
MKVSSIALAAFFACIPGVGSAQSTPFATINNPEGVVTGTDGSVYATWDNGLANMVSKFRPDGAHVWTTQLGGFIDFDLRGRLARHPGGFLLDMTTGGRLLRIDPSTGSTTVYLDLRTSPPDPTAVYDMTTNMVRNFTGDIFPSHLRYGDIAVLSHAGHTDIFITGLSLNTAFVMRLRQRPDGIYEYPRVLVAAALTTAGSVNQPRGVAANAAGTVLTNLPVFGNSFGAMDGAVAFDADMEPSPTMTRTPRLVLNTDLTSTGGTTDAAGNFYMATGKVGASACGLAGSGAVVVIPPTLDSFRCLTFNLVLANSRDVAISPGQDRAYVPVTELGGIRQFALAPPSRRLTVSVSGSGSVSSSPAGVSCPGTQCSPTFPYGTRVSLTPQAAPGWRFVQWAGACSGSSTCVVDMTADRAISVTFQRVIVPAVTVTLPNGGERLSTTTPVNIQWTSNATSTARVDVAVTTDGITFTAIAACTNLNGALRTCTWATPGPVSSTARLRVTVRDPAGTVSDVSNAPFSIASGVAAVAVTTPNTVVNWGIGSTQTIRWTHNVGIGGYVRVDVSRDGGATWNLVASSVKNSSSSAGTLSWRVTGPLTAQARIRVRWTGNTAVGDASDVNFTIANPFITVASPSSTATSWGYGTRQRQTWTTNLGPGDRVAVRLSTDGGTTFGTVLASSVVASNLTASFTVPTLGLVTTARTRVEWLANTAVHGTNAANFRIEPPFVRVTRPTLTTDAWTVGTTASIRWTHNLGTLERVKIDLSRDGGASFALVLLSATPSDGSQSVTVQSAWATATARVRISWVANATTSDVSDQTFTIR